MIVCFERMNEVVLRNQKAESERYSVKEENMIHFAIDYKNNCCIKIDGAASYKDTRT